MKWRYNGDLQKLIKRINVQKWSQFEGKLPENGCCPSLFSLSTACLGWPSNAVHAPFTTFPFITLLPPTSNFFFFPQTPTTILCLTTNLEYLWGCLLFSLRLQILIIWNLLPIFTSLFSFSLLFLPSFSNKLSFFLSYLFQIKNQTLYGFFSLFPSIFHINTNY